MILPRPDDKVDFIHLLLDEWLKGVADEIDPISLQVEAMKDYFTVKIKT